MCLAQDEKCFRVTHGNVKELTYFGCNHEERDARIILHSKDASQSKDAVSMICEDTDIFSTAIAEADTIGVPIYMKRGTQNRTQFVNINNIFANLGCVLSQSIPGIHTFTGCDCVFAGTGKVADCPKAFALTSNVSEYIQHDWRVN